MAKVSGPVRCSTIPYAYHALTRTATATPRALLQAQARRETVERPFAIGADQTALTHTLALSFRRPTVCPTRVNASRYPHAALRTALVDPTSSPPALRFAQRKSGAGGYATTFHKTNESREVSTPIWA